MQLCRMGDIPCDIEPVNYLLEDIPCFDMRTEKGRQDLEDLESPTDFIFIIPEVRNHFSIMKSQLS